MIRYYGRYGRVLFLNGDKILKMVNKEIIFKSLDDAIIKCRPTIRNMYTNFNPKDYKTERYSKKEGQIRTAITSPVGRLQQLQEDLQDEIEYTNEEKSILYKYQLNGFLDYSAWFYHTSKWAYHVDDETVEMWKEAHKRNPRNYRYELNHYKEMQDYWKYQVYNFHVNEVGSSSRYELDKPLTFKSYPIYDYTGKSRGKQIGSMSFDESINVMDDIIERSPPLQENTILYRNGLIDIDLKPGETGKWKGYSSTSFNSYVARNGLKKHTGGGLNWATSSRYQIKIYAPKGTKGVVPYAGLGCDDFQSEFLLPRNQRYILLNVDHSKHTAEVLLY